MTGASQTSTSRILLIEDSAVLAKIYTRYLRQEPYQVVHVETGEAALSIIEQQPPHAIMLDLYLPDMHGIDILRYITDRGLPTSVVIITAYGSIDMAVEAMRAGAFDFLVKPFDANRLTVTLRNALEKQRLARIVESLRADSQEHYCGFIGGSLAMQAIYRTIDSVAPAKATVFVTGESGTGKELCAEAIHRQSPRRDGPFIPLNCGAIPRELMESEIFGHTKGAFTSAVGERKGAAALADGGTLFLDEICEMDLDLQTKLLRFIQTGTLQPVGSSKLEKVDVRFVCATNKNPLKEVEEGRFREDLYYRLHVIPIHLPPLRERDNDVLLIAQHLLETYSAEQNRAFEGFSLDTQAILLDYPWPGNVRELQNVVQQIVVLNNARQVTPGMLPAPINSHVPSRPQAQPIPSAMGETAKPTPSISSIRPLEEVEREIIEEAITLCDDNIPRAAALLKIAPSTIYRKRQSWAEKGNG